MRKACLLLAAILFCGTMSVKAQVMKTADLEKYAKQKYGDKWLDAAKNLSEGLTLDKNESLTYQQVIEAPGKTKQQLYIALNYWVAATFKDNSAITLNDKDAGCIIVSSTIKNIAEHIGTINKYSVSITPVIRLDIKEVLPIPFRHTMYWPTSVAAGSVRQITPRRATVTPSARPTTRPMPTFMTNSGK